MFLETIKSQGLAHLSYLFGEDGEAAVVDPRRDCEIYVEKARAQGCRISNPLPQGKQRLRKTCRSRLLNPLLSRLHRHQSCSCRGIVLVWFEAAVAKA